MTFLKPSGLSIDTRSARFQKLNRKTSHSRLLLRRNDYLANRKLRDALEDTARSESTEQQFKRLLCEANIHRRQNAMEKAIICFRKCLQIKPGTLSVYIYLAKALENCQRCDEAYKVLQECIFTNSENPKAFDLMIDFCMNNDRYGEAKMLVQEALKLDSDNLHLHVKRCKILFHLGEFQNVIHFSSKILAKCRGRCVALRLLYVESIMKTMNLQSWHCGSSDTHSDSVRVQSLCESLQRIIKMAPKNVRAKMLYADLLHYQGKLEEAQKILRQAIVLDASQFS